MRASSVREISEAVREAAGAGQPVEVLGGGTRRGLGRPVQAARTIDVSGLAGITLYEPAELVIGAKAGTPLSVVEATLAEKGQMLPFEPIDHRALYASAGEPTIGGVVAVNASGPRRISAGACRDALIGAKFVNGRGEEIVSGGRVMKNVTGYDLLKLQCGAHGTLGVLTEVIFKVLPRPPAQLTLVWRGLTDETAVRLMCAAMGTPFEVTGAAHLPGEGGRTLIRLENFPQSLSYRAERVIDELERFGTPESLAGEAGERLWREVRDGVPLAAGGRAVWRLSTAPNKGAALLAAIRATRLVEGYYDWSGGLVWLATDATDAAGDAGAAEIRAALARFGGHATLMRAPDAVRAAVPPFEPESPALARLAGLTKAAFDPAGILNPGRMAPAT